MDSRREEPERKQQKSALLEQVAEEEGKTQKDKTTTVEIVENKVERMLPQQQIYLAIGGNLVMQSICLCHVACCMSQIMMSKGLSWKELSY